jgi:phytoene dehydrogenase-like protein
MKAAVVGSGVAGLAAALRLNNLGYTVTVFEKNSFFGGKLASFEKGGYRFDKGPSLFTLPNLMNDLFVLYGKNPSDYFNYKDLNIACNYFDKDYCFSAPTNPQNFGLEVEKQLGISKEIIVNYLNDSKKLLELSDPMFISDNKSF